MIATYVPLQLPHGGPNYYTFGQNIRYEIHVDNDASVVGDEITYRFTFNITNEDPSTFFNIRLGAQNQKATYTLERSVDGGASFQTIITDGVVPPNNIGPRSITSGAGLNTTYDALFNNAITTASTGETVFAGPTDDPFFVDLGGIFDLGDSPRQDGKNVDGVACYNVSAIAIQVPISTLLKAGAPSTPTNILDPDYVIGVWASASRPAITTISSDSDPSYSGDWVQVSRLGMPLTNEAVIAIGDKDAWNATSPYAPEEASFYDYFYNPELALYMDDSQFGGAVPSLAPLRIQSNSLGMFDFRNGQDGLFGLKGNPALDGTALDDAVFGTLLLPAAGNPRSVDLWPIFHTGVPNVIPYQLATGKDGNPLAAGKPFINNFLPNAGDMLRLNMAVPATPRDDANFSSLGLVQAAAIGLTVAPFNTTTDIEFIPNMDGFPNGRRLEDDVTRIELQAVGGIVLAAVGLWYDDFDGTTPLTDDLLGVLTYTTGVESNDLPFTGSFPYLAMPHSGTGPCSGEVQMDEEDDDGNTGGPDPDAIVYYSLDECNSIAGTSLTNQNYDEFVPVYPNALDCGGVIAGNVSRDNPTTNTHSCTSGVGGSIAMCVSSANSCTFRPNDPNAVTFTVTLEPTGISEPFISGLTFFEMAPRRYDWIDGPAGLNNYPTKYGLRVLKDGVEIFSSIGLDATADWTLESFEFTDAAFTVTSRSEFVFELLGYCTIDNGAAVNAWDLDEISVIGGCAANGAASISGFISTEQGELVEGVKVINDTDHPEYPVTTITNEIGEFIFDSNLTGKAYQISASKDNDYINGISTLDIVNIQRHILGLEVIQSPYDLIAADVNRSMNVSGADLVQLRKLILGISDEFVSNDSWLFVSTSEELNVQNPFLFDGVIEISNLKEKINDSDFIGIKVGDVNSSVIANSNQRFAEVRSDISLNLHYDDRAVIRGEIYNIDIKSNNFKDVYGFQFTTEFAGIELLDIKSNTIDLTKNNVGFIRPEIATMSFASGDALTSGGTDVLFTLQVKATQTGMLSEMVAISDAVTPIEAYINNSFERVSVKLESSEAINAESGFALYQNTPNPFNASTNISFNMKNAGEAAITIFDAAGKKIYQTTRTYTKGFNALTIESNDLRSSSSILFYQLSTEGFTATKKMTLID